MTPKMSGSQVVARTGPPVGPRTIPEIANAADQADRLRLAARNRLPSAHTIAITSGKGGVGKSSLAVNLSVCLAGHSIRVTLVDVDLGLANADLLLGIQPRYTLSHVLSGARSIQDIIMAGPGGIRLVPGASGVHSLANLSEFERRNLILQLQHLETSTDVMVLDCGAGISRTVLGFGLAADRVLVITTPQPTALTDAYATIKALHQEHCTAELCVVVNMAKSRREADATFERLASVAARFLNRPLVNSGYVLHDAVVDSAVRERCPFVIRHPGANASACVAAVAANLARALRRREGRSGFFQRVVGLFV